MSGLDAILDAQESGCQLDLDGLLATLEQEESGESLDIGDIVAHVDLPDFRGRIEGLKDGKASVRVLAGWRGPYCPTWPVSVPLDKLAAI